MRYRIRWMDVGMWDGMPMRGGMNLFWNGLRKDVGDARNGRPRG
jgi:hypothetical protein